MSERFVSGPIDIRCGDWRSVLFDVDKCDALITDPPFSRRTADGFRSSPNWGSSTPLGEQVGIKYGHIERQDVSDCCGRFLHCGARWMVAFGDHLSQSWWSKEADAYGWYSFAPIPWVKRNGAPRFMGDGPASVTEWISIARTRRDVRIDEDRGSRPGYYFVAVPHNSILPGQKSIEGMRALVRDYSRPGDIVVDPFCGTGTTAVACAIEGRRCITSEIDPKTYQLAVNRIKRGWTVLLPGMES